MEKFFNFIESHPQLVKLITFSLGLIIAWITGLFKTIMEIARKLDSKILVQIDPFVAKIVFVEENLYKSMPAQRFIIWLSVSIFNPSEKDATIRSFELQFKNRKSRWSKSLLPITFPNPPQQEIANSIRVLPVFFSKFPLLEKEFGYVSPDGRIKSNDFQNGYLLFQEHYYGDRLPLIFKKGVKIRIKCKNLRGKIYVANGYAQSVSSDMAFKMIPGLEGYKDNVKFLSSSERWEKIGDSRYKEGDC